jgi:hypothetical protein
MSAQHTPGPWSLHTDTNIRQGQLVRGDGTRLVTAYIANPHDARLIAAAPELLEALIALYDFRTTVNMERARAAIAKATGSAA